VLDQLKVERDRGITVKAQTATMLFHDERTDTEYLISNKTAFSTVIISE